MFLFLDHVTVIQQEVWITLLGVILLMGNANVKTMYKVVHVTGKNLCVFFKCEVVFCFSECNAICSVSVLTAMAVDIL